MTLTSFLRRDALYQQLLGQEATTVIKVTKIPLGGAQIMTVLCQESELVPPCQRETVRLCVSLVRFYPSPPPLQRNDLREAADRGS